MKSGGEQNTSHICGRLASAKTITLLNMWEVEAQVRTATARLSGSSLLYSAVLLLFAVVLITPVRKSRQNAEKIHTLNEPRSSP